MVYSKVQLICSVCGNQYMVPRCRAHTSKYCSKLCWSHRNPPRPKQCDYCGNVFETRIQTQRFCSRSCARSGNRSNAFKDGRSMERDRARLSVKLTKWRKAIFERDNYRCVICNGRGTLHAHHIQDWSNNPAKRFDLANGITVCIKCHGKIHSKDFTNRRTKTCPICGQQTKGRGIGGRCHSCAAKLQWSLIRNGKPSKITIPIDKDKVKA